MKRTPLTRSTPLRRRTRLRPRGNTKYRNRARDTGHMKLVRRLPCSAKEFLHLAPVDHARTPCWGRIEADHMGARGVGQKAADDTCAPMCTQHHRERTDYSGMFKGYSAAAMRTFCDWAIDRARKQVVEVARIRVAMGMR